jgi:hypothetical protein
MHALRGQAEVRAHRDPALDQEAHRVSGVSASFELDHLGARAHQRHSRRKGLLGARLIGAKRHVGDQERRTLALRHAARVVSHVLQGDRQRARFALDHVAERVTHQQDVDGGLVQHPGEGRVVTGQHGQLFALGGRLAQARQGDGGAGCRRRLGGRRMNTHGRSWKGRRWLRKGVLAATQQGAHSACIA